MEQTGWKLWFEDAQAGESRRSYLDGLFGCHNTPQVKEAFKHIAPGEKCDLRALCSLRELEILSLSGQLLPEDRRFLGHFPNLHTLVLEDCVIGDNDISFISQAQQLRWLHFPRGAVTVAGFEELALLPQLARLSIDDPLDVDDMRAISHSRSLQFVDVETATKDQLHALIRLLPNCSVHVGVLR